LIWYVTHNYQQIIALEIYLLAKVTDGEWSKIKINSTNWKKMLEYQLIYVHNPPTLINPVDLIKWNNTSNDTKKDF